MAGPADAAPPTGVVHTHAALVDPGKPNGPRFRYSYKRFASPRPNATTVLVLNGGPGATTMEHAPHGTYPLGGLTNGRYHIVYTDQRGSGANQSPLLGDAAFTTDSIARDVLSIVDRLQLYDYIVYGASFGTVQATRVAHLAAELGLPGPRALVLEGTLGRSPAGGVKEYVGNYQREWERVQRRLPAEARQALAGPALPFGATPEAWGAFLANGLIVGPVPYAEHPLVTQLRPLGTREAVGLAVLGAQLGATQLALTVGRDQLLPRMPDVILARELFGAARSTHLQGGRLVAAGRDRTDGRFRFRPYDSARSRLTMPIYYFQGTNDPASPEASARYHFDHQRRTHRAFVLVPEAAHGPLTLSLRTHGTAPLFWDAIDRADAAAFARAVQATPARISLEGKRPGE